MPTPECPSTNSSLRGEKEASEVKTGVSRLGHQGTAERQPEQQEVQQKSKSFVVKRSSRRWGGSDLYSGHCTKLPHLIGHLRCLREELASGTGMEGVGGRRGGAVTLGNTPHMRHRPRIHTQARTHIHFYFKFAYLLSSLWLVHSPERSLHF